MFFQHERVTSEHENERRENIQGMSLVRSGFKGRLVWRCFFFSIVFHSCKLDIVLFFKYLNWGDFMILNVRNSCFSHRSISDSAESIYHLILF